MTLNSDAKKENYFLFACDINENIGFLIGSFTPIIETI